MAFSSNAIIQSDNIKQLKNPVLKIPPLSKNNESAVSDDVSVINKSIETTFPSPIDENTNSDTVITFNPGGEVLYSIGKKKYKLYFDKNLDLQRFYVNDNEIPKNKWNKYKKPIFEVSRFKDLTRDNNVIIDSTSIKNQKKKKIIEELVEDMKNSGLIDKTLISYKVHFHENYLVINDERQPDELFQKYKQMYAEKANEKLDFNYYLNVSPNFYKKSPEEVKQMQIEYQKLAIEKLKLDIEKLRLNQEDLKKKYEKIKEVESKDAAQKQLDKNELQLEMTEEVLRNNEELLQKLQKAN
jgi:hypothetical protein